MNSELNVPRQRNEEVRSQNRFSRPAQRAILNELEKIFMNTHGGKREGSGIKKGQFKSRTLAIRAISDQAIALGVTPLEVLLDNMRFYHDKAVVLQTAIVQKVSTKGVLKNADAMELLNEFKELGEFRKLSGGFAVDAAPYVHARLSSTTVSGEITHKVEEAEASYKTIEHALDAAVNGEIIPAREKAKVKD